MANDLDAPGEQTGNGLHVSMACIVHHNDRGWSGCLTFGPRDLFRSASNEWYTSKDISALVRQLFAPSKTDLDSCSSLDANDRMRASAYYDQEAGGLGEANKWR